MLNDLFKVKLLYFFKKISLLFSFLLLNAFANTNSPAVPSLPEESQNASKGAVRKHMWMQTYQDMDPSKRKKMDVQCKKDKKKGKSWSPACQLIDCGEGNLKSCDALTQGIHQSTGSMNQELEQVAKRGLSSSDFAYYQSAKKLCLQGNGQSCQEESLLVEKSMYLISVQKAQKDCQEKKEQKACRLWEGFLKGQK